MQVVPTGGLDTDEGAQEFRVRGNQLRRKETFLHQPVFGIDVGNHRFQKIGTLYETIGQDLPFGFRDHHRDMRERPGALA